MKRYLIFLFAKLLALPMTFESCSDDDDNGPVSDGAPEVAAAGVYSGTFSRVKEGETTVYESAGTVTIEADKANFGNFILKCDEFAVDHNLLANITYAGEGFYFYNNSVVNALSSIFLGRINAEKEMTVTFTLKQRSGRVTTTYKYTFVGKKASGE